MVETPWKGGVEISLEIRCELEGREKCPGISRVRKASVKACANYTLIPVSVPSL